ncbi:MAG: glycosyltransferase family 4 protein [Lachnospiraceae bacterium]|nr:glycosyltransferase family 4 protein [Lachnospiraceae bacterium]
MKLMVDARTFGTAPSGVGIYGYRFVKAFVTRTQWEVVLVSDVAESEEINHLIDKKIPCLIYGANVKKNTGVIGYFRFVQKMIDKERPDVFWEINNVIPIKLHNHYGKIAVTIHDLFPLSMPECFNRIYPYYYKWGIRNVLASADILIYVSGTVMDEMEKIYPASQKKLRYISYNIGCENIEISDASRTVEREGYLLYIGNLEKRKGTDILLKAYKKYRTGGGDLGLHIAGKIREEEINKLLELTKKEEPEISYLGYISEEQKAGELAGCRVFVFPSRAEGFGIPVIEALAYDKPVITSDLPIFEELFKGAINTFKLDRDETGEAAADGLAEAMESVRTSDQKVIRDIVYRYSEDSLAPGMINLFENCR